MEKLIRIRFGACFGLLMVITVLAFGDWQFWNTESIEGKLAENWKVKLEEEFRFTDGIKEFYYHHTDGSLTYRLTDWFYPGLNYRQIYEKKDGEWEEEKRPHFSGTFKWKWQDFKFKDRNRFEYRIRKEKNDVWRYRNKLSLIFPIRWTKLMIQPYLADEVFINLENAEFSRNRLYAGINLRFFSHLKTVIFYLWQTSNKDSGWIDYNIVGAKLKVEF
ncbi:MAG TPA: DUF2490 domain-containing protein [bacterium (Candidatus Stahlbacteria)]|nr:DUF2490 domain-containing protein [Candidatus Stahlbacteria bacterium]